MSIMYRIIYYVCIYIYIIHNVYILYSFIFDIVTLLDSQRHCHEKVRHET